VRFHILTATKHLLRREESWDTHDSTHPPRQGKPR
jgi:hypothetical protein